MGCICLGVKKITHLDIIKERKKEEGVSSTALPFDFRNEAAMHL